MTTSAPEPFTPQVKLPEKLAWVFRGDARVRGAWGGRGSGKTRGFATMAAVRALDFAYAGEGGIVGCYREFQKSLRDSSMAEVKAAIEADEFLRAHFEVGEEYIRTRPGLPARVDFSFEGLRRNLANIKSTANLRLVWVDEAERVSEAAWAVLMPTVRQERSEVWVTWNPERKTSATNQRFHSSDDPSFRITELSWRENPWFPDVLNEERKRDLRERPETYEHVWEGDFITVKPGAYFTTVLLEARREGRIVPHLPVDKMLPLYAFADIGGAGARADAFVFWVVQFVSGRIHVVDFYESVGQTLDFHADWLRRGGYDRAKVILPHDGLNTNNVSGKTYADHWRDAGFAVDTIPNQGPGAAMQRIESVRREMHRCVFADQKTEAGRELLSLYHAKVDEERGVDLGPEHDDASHAADAFGMMCLRADRYSRRPGAPEKPKALTMPAMGVV